MPEPVYEFSAEASGSRKRNWTGLALLAATLVVAAWWGIGVLERERADAIRQKTFRLETGRYNNVVAAICRAKTIQSGDLALLGDFPKLRYLDLSAAVSGDLRGVSRLHSLRVLKLSNCRWVDDEQASHLRGLDELKMLSLSGTQVTDAGLRAIRDLPGLRGLSIGDCRKITDRGLEICGEMNQLQELSVGGTGCTIDGLIALRETRRDLHLGLTPDDLVRSRRGRSKPKGGTVNRQFGVVHFGFNRRSDNGLRDRRQGLRAVLSTAADIDALCDVLRFKHRWLFSSSLNWMSVPIPAVQHESNYEEHVKETWETLMLSGPAASQSLAAVLPLTPNLAELRFYETALSQPLLRQIRQQSTIELISLSDVSVEGTEITHAKLGAFATFLQTDGLAGGTADNNGKNENTAELYGGGEPAGPMLEALLPVLPDLAVLEIRSATLTAEGFPFELLPETLHRLHIADAKLSESFLRELARHTALEHLVLSQVALDDVGLADPALGHFTSLASLRLWDVTVGGVALTDPAMEKLRDRLHELLPETWTLIYFLITREIASEWGTPPDERAVHPASRQPD